LTDIFNINHGYNIVNITDGFLQTIRLPPDLRPPEQRLRGGWAAFPEPVGAGGRVFAIGSGCEAAGYALLQAARTGGRLPLTVTASVRIRKKLPKFLL